MGVPNYNTPYTYGVPVLDINVYTRSQSSKLPYYYYYIVTVWHTCAQLIIIIIRPTRRRTQSDYFLFVLQFFFLFVFVFFFCYCSPFARLFEIRLRSPLDPIFPAAYYVRFIVILSFSIDPSHQLAFFFFFYLGIL